MQTVRYVEGTRSGPSSATELESFLRMMQVDDPSFEYDADYARFIGVHHGGKPVADHFQCDGDRHVVDRFLNFSDDAADSIFNVQQTWNLIEDRLVAGVFPFAALPGGDFLVFDRRGPAAPQVMLWRHESSSEGDPHLVFVARNFEEFLYRLRPL